MCVSEWRGLSDRPLWWSLLQFSRTWHGLFSQPSRPAVCGFNYSSLLFQGNYLCIYSLILYLYFLALCFWAYSFWLQGNTCLLVRLLACKSFGLVKCPVATICLRIKQSLNLQTFGIFTQDNTFPAWPSRTLSWNRSWGFHELYWYDISWISMKSQALLIQLQADKAALWLNVLERCNKLVFMSCQWAVQHLKTSNIVP